MQRKFVYNGQLYNIQLQKTSKGYDVTVNGVTYTVDLIYTAFDELNFLIDGDHHHAHVAASNMDVWVASGGKIFQLEISTQSTGKSRKQPTFSTDNILISPMPGHVRDVQVKVGGLVETGQTMILIEAMKMEIRIQAPYDGKVESIMVKKGELIQKDQPLLELSTLQS